MTERLYTDEHRRRFMFELHWPVYGEPGPCLLTDGWSSWWLARGLVPRQVAFESNVDPGASWGKWWDWVWSGANHPLRVVDGPTPPTPACASPSS
jgi:hypothetical protein